jgi:uncharacterized membrane protein
MKQKTSLRAIFLMIFCTLFTATGQFFLKKGSATIAFNLSALLTNIPLLLGIFLYMIGAVLLIIALKSGELSVLFPFVALSFVWVLLLSLFFLGEKVSVLNVVGIVCIMAGTSLVGYGRK